MPVRVYPVYTRAHFIDQDGSKILCLCGFCGVEPVTSSYVVVPRSRLAGGAAMADGASNAKAAAAGFSGFLGFLPAYARTKIEHRHTPYKKQNGYRS